MFLRDEAAAVQLLPYGWEHAPGTRKALIRGNHYQAVVVSTRGIMEQDPGLETLINNLS